MPFPVLFSYNLFEFSLTYIFSTTLSNSCTFFANNILFSDGGGGFLNFQIYISLMDESTKRMLKHSNERFRNAYLSWYNELKRQGAINVASSWKLIPAIGPVIPAIFEGDKIIYEGGSSTCIIVTLYDPKKPRGTMVHLGVTNVDQFLRNSKVGAQEVLTGIINQFRSAGSKRVLAMLAGGIRDPRTGSKEDKKKSNSAKIWKLVLEILEENSDIVQRVKVKDIKDVYIHFIVLYLKTGLVKYLAADKKTLFNDEFTLE